MIGIREKTFVSDRWMLRVDLPEVLATESYLSSPWMLADFLQHLRQQDHIGYVAERGDSVVAHSIYHLTDECIHLLRLAVHPDYRRLGIASQLVRALKSKLSPHRRTRITMQVPERALDLQLFLRAAGFRCETILGTEYAFAFRRTAP